MKRFITILVALTCIFAFVGGAQAEWRDMWAEVYSWDGSMNARGERELVKITSGITYQVLQADSDTAETLYVYASDAFTSYTNPVTTTYFNAVDRVQFRVDPGETNDADVDLIVTNTSGGFTAVVEDFNQYRHTIVIDQRPGVRHQGVIWFTASSAVETDTGIDFLTDSLVTDVRTETVTIDASATIDVGLLSTESSGDADGFIDGRSVATAGFTADTGVITNGSYVDYIPDSTYGALLYTIIAGSDTTAAEGGRSYLGHVITGSNAVSLTYTGSAGSDTAAGYIYYDFIRLRP